MLLGCVGNPAFAPSAACPPGYATIERSLTINGSAWAACEDLQEPGGALVLLSSDGKAEWFSKSYEVYTRGTWTTPELSLIHI